MNGTPTRLSWVLRVTQIWALLTLTALAITLAWYIGDFVRDAFAQGAALDGVIHFVIWLILLFSGAVGVGVVYSLVYAVVAGAEAAQTGSDRLSRIESVADALLESNRRLVDLAQMSDAARSLIFRRREIQVMNEQLHEYLIRQDYAAAEALTAEAEKRPGYAQEAQAMRREMAAARSSTEEQRIDSAVARITALLAEHDWTRASEQAQRLLRLAPGNAKVAALPQQVREAKANHKRNLLQEYDQAVKAGQLDRSIEMIQELDKYLTPQEAAALQESARGVFKAKLLNLGVQFSIRVSENNWTEAVAAGQQIVRDFPNSRMAQEVRDKMDTLKARAASQTATAPLPEKQS
jgi:hypothetical protein